MAWQESDSACAGVSGDGKYWAIRVVEQVARLTTMSSRDRDKLEQELRTNLLAKRANLAQLWEEMNGHWAFEDGVYRFYHQSYKVFRLQEHTTRIVETLQSILPGQPLNPWFLQIVKEGTGKTFETGVDGRSVRGHAADH